jgi:hypothetical protein
MVVVKLRAQSFVIVDHSSGPGYGVRNALLGVGATVHVFRSCAAALMLVQHKKVDAVLVEFANDKPTADFCNAVRRLKVPIVFSTPPAHASDLRNFGFEIGFPARSDSPVIFVPYQRRLMRRPGKDKRIMNRSARAKSEQQDGR